MAKKTSEEKNTTAWTTGLLTKTFGLMRVLEGYPLLESWLNISEKLTTAETEKLEKLRLKLLKNVNSWNEETLKMRFIALVLDMVEYETTSFEPLFDNEMSGVVDSTALKVITDFMIAKTIDDIVEKPYFYFHEYKRKKKGHDDPIAQVLIAMLIAQVKNQDDKPIYGCHVIGENWYFMVLNGREYAIDKGFNATKVEELQRIFIVLKGFKQILSTLD
jgi:hypothetical protein